MEKVLVSSCLLGINCRWHGKKCNFSGFIKKFIKNNAETELIEACPEMLGGLSCPRQPVKRKNGQVFETCPDKAMRKYVTGKELTKEFKQGAEKTLEICKENNIKKAILCKWSPSCDINGITGKLLASNGIEIINTW